MLLRQNETKRLSTGLAIIPHDANVRIEGCLPTDSALLSIHFLFLTTIVTSHNSRKSCVNVGRVCINTVSNFATKKDLATESLLLIKNRCGQSAHVARKGPLKIVGSRTTSSALKCT